MLTLLSCSAPLLLAFAMLFATIAVTPQTRTGTSAITHVSVVDVLNGRIVPNSTVTISGDTISGVAQNGAVPADAQVIDGQGKYLIPGLWDMHAHVEMTGQSWLQLHVANGITGIRDMGSDLDFIVRMRQETAAGRILGPRIVAAGPILDDAPGEWPFRMRVRTPDEGRAAVQCELDTLLARVTAAAQK